MGYDRNELITVGERFNTESLLEWSQQIVQAARQDLARLKSRGLDDKTLRAVETARDEVKKLNFAQERERSEFSTAAAARRETLEAAFEWREELKGLAVAVFDSEPDVLARFRTGTKVSRSLPKLGGEIGLLVAALREHLGAFKGVGVTETFAKQGEDLVRRLDEAQRKLAEDRSQSPAAQLWQAQGVLYTRTRFIARIAQVEFRRDAERQARYAYSPVRTAEDIGPSRRRKTTAVAH